MRHLAQAPVPALSREEALRRIGRPGVSSYFEALLNKLFSATPPMSAARTRALLTHVHVASTLATDELPAPIQGDT